VGQVCGLGLDSYLVGLERLVKEQLRAAPGTAKPKAAAGGMGLLRISITEIDTQLVKLFNRRMELSEKVAAEKAVSALELQNCVFSACANRRFVLHSSLVGIMGGFKMGRFTSLNDRTAATRHGDADCRPRGILYPYSSGCTRTPWQSAGDTRAMATPPPVGKPSDLTFFLCERRLAPSRGPAANVQQPTSNIPLPAANVQHPTSNSRQPTSNCPLPAADSRLPTSNCPLPTSDCCRLQSIAAIDHRPSTINHRFNLKGNRSPPCENSHPVPAVPHSAPRIPHLRTSCTCRFLRLFSPLSCLAARTTAGSSR